MWPPSQWLRVCQGGEILSHRDAVGELVPRDLALLALLWRTGTRAQGAGLSSAAIPATSQARSPQFSSCRARGGGVLGTCGKNDTLTGLGWGVLSSDYSGQALSPGRWQAPGRSFALAANCPTKCPYKGGVSVDTETSCRHRSALP